MKMFNLINEKISVNQVDFISAVNKGIAFGITHEGEIASELETNKKPLIFKGKAQRQSAVSTQPLPITQALGKNYTLSINGPKLDIQASLNWQEIIGFNMNHADYDDSTGDGISHFPDSDMEDMGWHATDFDITYRSMVEHLEETVEGVILCIEREEPYQFSGLGFFNDVTQARESLKQFLTSAIKEKIANDKDFAPNKLDEDQEEALEFFGISL